MNNLFKINGNPEQYEDLDVFHKLAQQFLPYAQQSLGFDKPVGVNLLSDPENVEANLMVVYIPGLDTLKKTNICEKWKQKPI